MDEIVKLYERTQEIDSKKYNQKMQAAQERFERKQEVAAKFQKEKLEASTKAEKEKLEAVAKAEKAKQEAAAKLQLELYTSKVEVDSRIRIQEMHAQAEIGRKKREREAELAENDAVCKARRMNEIERPRSGDAKLMEGVTELKDILRPVMHEKFDRFKIRLFQPGFLLEFLDSVNIPYTAEEEQSLRDVRSDRPKSYKPAQQWKDCDYANYFIRYAPASSLSEEDHKSAYVQWYKATWRLFGPR